MHTERVLMLHLNPSPSTARPTPPIRQPARHHGKDHQQQHRARPHVYFHLGILPPNVLLQRAAPLLEHVRVMLQLIRLDYQGVQILRPPQRQLDVLPHDLLQLLHLGGNSVDLGVGGHLRSFHVVLVNEVPQGLAEALRIRSPLGLLDLVRAVLVPELLLKGVEKGEIDRMLTSRGVVGQRGVVRPLPPEDVEVVIELPGSCGRGRRRRFFSPSHGPVGTSSPHRISGSTAPDPGAKVEHASVLFGAPARRLDVGDVNERLSIPRRQCSGIRPQFLQ
mmetsp:Transcript_46757/g.141653  ORF Transcript_46757/g.141653 Transcript_46757/m.141653 type:complete len:277 (+) Transcript_46757:424-1254(+)